MMKLSLILALLVMTCDAVAAGTFRNLGPQISATLLQGSTFTPGSSGQLLVCCVVRGQPAKLMVFDATTGEMLHRFPLEHAEGAWNATTASDGSVYVGTDHKGRLYRWVVGESAARDLGKVPPDESFVWDVTPGADGEVFCGTYPGCRVVRYHPDSGFEDLSRGAMVEKENYVRSLAYDAAHGKIYGGVGSHAHLIELDLKTGEKTDLLPREHRDQEFVYSVRLVGERLFAVVTNSAVGLVFNTKTREFEPSVPGMPGALVITKHPRDERVFYTVSGKLWTYDPAKAQAGPKEVCATAEARAFTWEGDRLVMFTRNGLVLRVDVETGERASVTCKVPPEPVPIQSIALGPDGKIWMGGYLSGGSARFDPATAKREELKGLSQAESITSLGSSLYFGIYPHARFYTYDTSKPWDVKRNNPKMIGKIDGQSRPFGAVGVEELNQVIWGTVPEYGLLGGGIAVYDVGAEKLEFFADIVSKQSVISLAHNSGLIVGGTSIHGGLGIEPSEKAGKLFLWDPKARTKVYEVELDEKASAVMALVNGPDGNVWGFVGSKLFSFDVGKRKVVFMRKLLDTMPEPSERRWRGPSLRAHPSGVMYGDLDGKLFRLDPKSMKVEVLREEASLTTLDREGNVYFRDRINLWQYVP